MIKRVVIAGCRNYNNYKEAKEYIDFCLSNIRKYNDIIILCGGAKGADFLGEVYANENGFKVEYFKAEWDKYGKATGPKRNEEMAKNCDYVICFWNNKSKETKSMIEYSKFYNKPIKIKLINT